MGPGCEDRIANEQRVKSRFLLSSPFTTKGDSLDKSQDQIEVEAPVYQIKRKGATLLIKHLLYILELM